MQNTIREAKQALRNQVGARLKSMEPGERAAASAQARTLLASQPLWKSAQWVLFYAPLPEELDVWPLVAEALSAGKRVALPRFIAENGTYEACQIQDVKWICRWDTLAFASPPTDAPGCLQRGWI